MLADHHSRLLTGLVDGQLSPQEHQQAQELLRRSAEARKLLQDLQTDARLISSMPRVHLPDEFTRQVQEALPKRTLRIERPAEKPARRFSWRSAGVLAAAASLLLAVAVALSQRNNGPAQPLLPEPELPDIVRNDVENPEQAPPVKSPSLPDTKQLVSTPRPGVAAEALGMPKPEGDSIHTAPVANAARLRDINLEVPLLLAMRELEKETRRQEVLEELALADAWRFDLHCQESEVATNRLKRSLQGQGIQLLVEPDALDRQRLRLPRTTYAALVENVTPKECLTLLNALREVDRQEFARSRSSNQFIDVKIGRMSSADSNRLESLFGIVPIREVDKAPLTRHVNPAVISRDPDVMIVARTRATWQEQKRPEGQGGERHAFLVADSATRVRRPSNEGQIFLNGRQPPKQGLLQILIILNPRKG